MNKIYLLLIGFFFLQMNAFAQNLAADEKRALLHVIVTDFENSAQVDEVVVFVAKSSGKSVKRKTDAKGEFDILLPKGETYQIKYTSFLEEKESSEIEIPNDPGIMEATLSVQMESAVNEVFELDIHFQTAKSAIHPQSFQVLDELVSIMRERSTTEIEVAGHTDNEGSAESNLKLSQDRADAVKAYLVQKGISSKRVQTKGYGEAKPVVSNATAQGKARNRRTEIRVISQ